jgi:hypothetical protein
MCPSCRLDAAFAVCFGFDFPFSEAGIRIADDLGERGKTFWITARGIAVDVLTLICRIGFDFVCAQSGDRRPLFRFALACGRTRSAIKYIALA